MGEYDRQSAESTSAPLQSIAPDEPLQTPAPAVTPAPLGNQDAQRQAMMSYPDQEQAPTAPVNELDVTSRLVTVHFDRNVPWMVWFDDSPTEDQIIRELYGLELSVPLRTTKVATFDRFMVKWEDRFIIEPRLLRPEYAERYLAMRDARQLELELQLIDDFYKLQELLDVPPDYYGLIEDQVLEIIRKWAMVRFRPSPPRNPNALTRSYYLDELFGKLRFTHKDIGLITTNLTNYYSLMFNHFDHLSELRRLRDDYSTAYVGDEGEEEVTFWGVFWDDVKTGNARDRIFGYFVGLKDAGVGLVTGLAHMGLHPIQTVEAIGKLPQTLSTLWEHKGELWNKFVNAPPEEQGRMIGRLFGEIEILIGTAGAGGSAGTAAKAPELAQEVAVVGRNVAALGPRGAAITVDLGKLGEAGRLTTLMAATTDVARGSQETAEDLRADESKLQSKAPEERLPAEKPIHEEQPNIPPGEAVQKALPTARGAAVEVRLLELLGLRKLPNWFKTIDGIEGGTWRMIKRNGREISQYTDPVGVSVKSTKVTDVVTLQSKVTEGIEALRNFTRYTRTESGITVEVRGLARRVLYLVFDEEAVFVNEREILDAMKRFARQARSQGVEFRWRVVRGESIYDGPSFFKDVRKMIEELE